MRPTIPKLLGLVFAAALAGHVFVVAPTMPAGPREAGAAPPPRPVPGQTRAVFPPAGKKFIGIMTSGGPYDFAQLDSFTRAVGQQPSVYEFAQSWAVNQFSRAEIDKVADRGMLPLISWEPWDYRKAPANQALRGDQPAYRLSAIIDGWRRRRRPASGPEGRRPVTAVGQRCHRVFPRVSWRGDHAR